MSRSILLFIVLLLVPVPGKADSLSLGDPSRGRLQSGSLLPATGEGFRFLPIILERDFRYGLEEITSLIQESARLLHQEHRLTLQLGNFSRKGGGNIPQSRSHNSGRDADIAFQMRDREDVPAPLERFLLINENLEDPKGELFFHPGDNWKVIRTLLLREGTQIAWIFVASHLRSALLQEARAESLSLQLRASTILRQPSDSAPHDDHFHVRIYCPLDQWETCEDGVTRWPWVPSLPLREVIPAHEEGPTSTTRERIQGLLLNEDWTTDVQEKWNQFTNHKAKSQDEARDWWNEASGKTPREWWDAGYLEAGCQSCLTGGLGERVSSLIKAIKRSPTIRYRALRDLPLLTGNPKSAWSWTSVKAHRYWSRWWKQNRNRYGL